VEGTVGLQLLQHATGHFTRTADQTRQFLAGYAQLGALRVAHGLRLAGQVVQGADDAVGHIQEGQAAGLAAGVQQAPGELGADGVQQLRGIGGQRAQEQLVQALVADFRELALGAGTQDHLAAVGFDEKAHFADELAGTEVAEDQFAVVVLLGDDADRAADHVIERACRVARSEHIGARRISAPMAVGQEALKRGVVRRQRAGGGASGGY